jgi:predicted DsbA family dithiol-disulfide isomerase/uncharacterized membrane protein
MPSSPARHRFALALALVGVAVSVFTLVIHQRVEAGGYTSFCNLGGVVNCDQVLASRFGQVLGVPVAGWGAAAFLAGAALAIPGALGVAAPIADLLLLGLVSASVGFAVVLLGVSVIVLHYLCLLCLTLDTVILLWAIAVIPLVRRFQPAARGAGWWRGRGVADAVIAAGLVLAVAGGTWAAVRAPAPVTTAEELRSREPRFYDWYTKLPVRPVHELIPADGHAKGADGAPVVIVEFSDFQCPFCVQAFRDLREFIRKHPEVRLVFRHFPLDSACNDRVTHSVHPDACLAARAAECGGQQGRFWELHDTLFENHDRLERESLFGYARDLGLDIPRFRACLDHPDTLERVKRDVAAGAQAGVQSTPTFFINGRVVEGAFERAYWDYALLLERHAAHRHTPGGAS